MIAFADSHCHLDDDQFDADRSAVVERAQAAGVTRMLAIGTGDGPPDLGAALRIAEQYPFVMATAGVHPNDASKADKETFAHLAELLQHPKIKAVGEIGLDYHWDVSPEVQKPLFVRQLELAAQAKLPVIIHTRDAWGDTLAVLKEVWTPTKLPCVIHCFTGDAQQASECLQQNFYLAFGGIATYPKSDEVRKALKLVPNDRLLLETDCPYLAPVPYRGRRNEPAYVVDTARIVAETRQTTLEQLSECTNSNFDALFN